jgi:hypothetical protein
VYSFCHNLPQEAFIKYNCNNYDPKSPTTAFVAVNGQCVPLTKSQDQNDYIDTLKRDGNKISISYKNATPGMKLLVDINCLKDVLIE